jgi:hypothetical protein
MKAVPDGASTVLVRLIPSSRPACRDSDVASLPIAITAPPASVRDTQTKSGVGAPSTADSPDRLRMGGRLAAQFRPL